MVGYLEPFPLAAAGQRSGSSFSTNLALGDLAVFRLCARARSVELALLCSVILSTYGFGQFETRGEFLAASGPNSIAVGDFNHDGKLDLAVVGGDTNADTPLSC